MSVRVNSADQRSLVAASSGLVELTEEVAKAASGKFAPDIIFRLSLSNQGLSKITGLERCTNLTDLELTNCSIGRIEGLTCLTSLTRLTLVSNKISNVEGLQNLQKLQLLNLQDNKVETINNLNLEQLHALPKLTVLYLQNLDGSARNPVCCVPGYKKQVLSKLTSLTNLDGERSPKTGSYMDAVETMQQLAANPPAPLESLLPQFQPILAGKPTLWDTPDGTEGQPGQDVAGGLVGESKRLVVLLDECVMLHTVLRENMQQHRFNAANA